LFFFFLCQALCSVFLNQSLVRHGPYSTGSAVEEERSGFESWPWHLLTMWSW
jgi:hypothetical protein